MALFDDFLSGASKFLSGGDLFTGLLGGGLKMMANQEQQDLSREQFALNQQEARRAAAQAQDFNFQQAELGRQFAREQSEFGASQADIARQFSARQQTQAETFNASQAELNRNFQERMSSTAYQRSRADMLAAGLNPILAAGAGGASTPGGGQGAVGAVTGPAASGMGASSASIGVGPVASMRDRAALLEGAVTSASEMARLKPSIDAIRQQTALGAEQEATQRSLTDFNRKSTALKHAEIAETEARTRQIEKATKLAGSDVSALGVSGNIEGVVDLARKYLNPQGNQPGLGAGSKSSALESSSSAGMFDRLMGGWSWGGRSGRFVDMFR